MSSASFTSVSAAPSLGVSGRSASLSDISMVEFIASPRVATDSWGADIACPGRTLEAADGLRRDQQRKPVGRRNQAEYQRGDDDHAHVQRVDVADFGELADDGHEDDDRRNRVDEVTDDDEYCDQQQHDHLTVVAREAGDV